MNERDIQKQIMDYLAARRQFAIRMNTGAFVLGEGKSRRYLRTHSLGAGTADILVPAAGSHWIECKNEHGRLQDLQKRFAEMVEGTYGHVYLVARSIDDLKGFL